MRRRQVLQALGMMATIVLLPGTRHDGEAQAPVDGQTTAFAATDVQKVARDLATKPFVPPKHDLPKALQQMTYDQYRDIRFKRERGLCARQARKRSCEPLLL